MGPERITVTYGSFALIFKMCSMNNFMWNLISINDVSFLLKVTDKGQ